MVVRRTVVGSVLAALLLSLVCLKATLGDIRYTVTDLGTLPGGASSQAYGINASGQVVGQAANASGNTHAFLYSGGVMSDLGTLGGPYSYARGINDSGQIVGWSYLTTAFSPQHAFLYTSGGSMTDLGVPSGYTDSFAVGIIPGAGDNDTK
jgi:probable HAF family extracellular repeat protein